MASMTDLVSWEEDMAGDVVEKEVEGIKEEVGDAKIEGLECRIGEEAAVVLL